VFHFQSDGSQHDLLILRLNLEGTSERKKERKKEKKKERENEKQKEMILLRILHEFCQ